MSSKFLHQLLFVSVFGTAVFIGQSIRIEKPKISMERQALNFNYSFIRYTSVGLNQAIADIVWIQTLLQADLEHYRGGDLNSWLYLRFSSIAHLAPRFYENYLNGGEYLMIIKDDVLGAEDLFRRGLEQFPNDLTLNWRMGYLQAIEKSEPAKAYEYFARIRHNPKRAAIFDSIFAKIATAYLGPEESYALIYETWNSMPGESKAKDRLQIQLYALKAKRDLECLNGKANKDCSRTDFEGQPYIYSEGQWRASKPLAATELRLKKR